MKSVTRQCERQHRCRSRVTIVLSSEPAADPVSNFAYVGGGGIFGPFDRVPGSSADNCATDTDDNGARWKNGRCCDRADTLAHELQVVAESNAGRDVFRTAHQHR